MDPRAEMRELQRLFEQAPQSAEFIRLRRNSRWGERIREQIIDRIKLCDPTESENAIEDGILFLEENPRYFRTGYFKAAIASKLKGVRLSEVQRDRLLSIVLNATQSADVGPEFSEYARLAAVIATADFLHSVAGFRDQRDGWSRRRCERILALFPDPAPVDEPQPEQ